jgi:hypothetical protein
MNTNRSCLWPNCSCATEKGDPCKFENPDFYITKIEPQLKYAYAWKPIDELQSDTYLFGIWITGKTTTFPGDPAFVMLGGWKVWQRRCAYRNVIDAWKELGITHYMPCPLPPDRQ